MSIFKKTALFSSLSLSFKKQLLQTIFSKRKNNKVSLEKSKRNRREQTKIKKISMNLSINMWIK